MLPLQKHRQDIAHTLAVQSNSCHAFLQMSGSPLPKLQLAKHSQNQEAFIGTAYTNITLLSSVVQRYNSGLILSACV